MATHTLEPRDIAAPAAGVLHLTSVEGGERYALAEGATTIGAGPRCDLRLDGQGLRPLHCVITHEAHGAVVRRWAAGALLNGLPFTESPLRDGDLLKLGSVELVFNLPMLEPQPHEAPEVQEDPLVAEDGAPLEQADEADEGEVSVDEAGETADARTLYQAAEDEPNLQWEPTSESEAPIADARQEPDASPHLESTESLPLDPMDWQLEKPAPTTYQWEPELGLEQETAPGDSASGQSTPSDPITVHLLEHSQATHDNAEEPLEADSPEPQVLGPPSVDQASTEEDSPEHASSGQVSPEQELRKQPWAEEENWSDQPWPAPDWAGASVVEPWETDAQDTVSLDHAPAERQARSSAPETSEIEEADASEDLPHSRAPLTDHDPTDARSDHAVRANRSRARRLVRALRGERRLAVELNERLEALQHERDTLFESLELASDQLGKLREEEQAGAAELHDARDEIASLKTALAEAELAVEQLREAIAAPLAEASATAATKPTSNDSLWESPLPSTLAERPLDNAEVFSEPSDALHQHPSPESPPPATAGCASSELWDVERENVHWPDPTANADKAATEPRLPNDPEESTRPAGLQEDSPAADVATPRDENNGEQERQPVSFSQPALGPAATDQPVAEESLSPSEASADATADAPPEPATAGFDPPKSFYEQYAHLLPNDDEPPVDAPSPPPAAPAQTAPQPGPAAEDAGDDDDIDSYMAQLMQRMRGGSGDSVGSAPVAASSQRSAAPDPTPPAPPPQRPMLSLDELKRTAIPEQPTDMDSLRRLANHSARQAIGVATSKQNKEESIANLIIANIALGSGGYLVSSAPAVMSAQLVGGVFALLLAGVWVYRSVAHLVSAIRNGSFDESPEQAPEGPLPIAK